MKISATTRGFDFFCRMSALHALLPLLALLAYSSRSMGDAPDAAPTHPITLVTAYFPTKNERHSMTEFDDWVSNFLRFIETPIVLYASIEVGSPGIVVQLLAELYEYHFIGP